MQRELTPQETFTQGNKRNLLNMHDIEVYRIIRASYKSVRFICTTTITTTIIILILI